MGIDPVHLINHDLYFEKPGDFLTAFQKRIGMPVMAYSFQQELPGDFSGWSVCFEDEASLQDYYEKGNMMQQYQQRFGIEPCSIHFNPFLFEFSNNDFYMGRWSSVKYLVDWIKENGIPPPEYYTDNNTEALWIFQARKKRYDYSRLFNSTSMITFCSDRHPAWLDHFAETRWTFDQFHDWGKKQFIYIKFQELVHVDFPENAPDYYNVFIYDDFEDLKSEHITWKQPFTSLYFSATLPKHVTDTQAFLWQQTLIEEAAKWNLHVYLSLNDKLVSGELFFIEKDFQLHLARHFITSFFKSRGLKATISF